MDEQRSHEWFSARKGFFDRPDGRQIAAALRAAPADQDR